MAAYQTRAEQFVVCLNTMGQDRGFSEEEMKFALRAVREYREKWIGTECGNLEKDIGLRIV